MTVSSDAERSQGGRAEVLSTRAPAKPLTTAAIVLGLAWALAFVIVGVACSLQLYGDGAIFSYAVTVQDSFGFHFRNISSRLFVWLFALKPAELYVGATGHAAGGIALYGALFFSAPLLGLIATFFADRSQGRTFFIFACGATALLCPLVFGAPTEVWMAQAAFWPTLALCHFAGGALGTALVFAAMPALLFTHESALIFAGVILLTLLVREQRALFARAALAFGVALLAWLAVRVLLPPDDYIAPVLKRAAMSVFDWRILLSPIVLLLAAALGGYAILLQCLRRAGMRQARRASLLAVAAMLGVWWVFFDTNLHTQDRYFLRTVLILILPLLGALAALQAIPLDERSRLLLRAWSLAARLRNARVTLALTGALALTSLVYAVETFKFVRGFADYKAAIAALASGEAADPALGDARFVSSARIGLALNRLNWFSTTPYLSVLVAPGFAPKRLVVDPAGNYFWLSCATARHNAQTPRALPAASQELIATYSCLHRA